MWREISQVYVCWCIWQPKKIKIDRQYWGKGRSESIQRRKRVLNYKVGGNYFNYP